MRLGQRLDPTEKRGLEIFDIVGRPGGRCGNRLHHGERVFDAMMQLPNQERRRWRRRRTR